MDMPFRVFQLVKYFKNGSTFPFSVILKDFSSNDVVFFAEKERAMMPLNFLFTLIALDKRNA